MNQTPSIYSIVGGQCGHHWFREEAQNCPICLSKYDKERYAQLTRERDEAETRAKENERQLVSLRETHGLLLLELDQIKKTVNGHIAAREHAVASRDRWKANFQALKQAMEESKEDITVIRLNPRPGRVFQIVLSEEGDLLYPA